MIGVRLGGALLLGLSMSLPLYAQGTNGDLTANPVQPSWWQKLVGTKTVTKPEKGTKPLAQPTIKPNEADGPTPDIQQGVDRDRELNAFFRRQEVVDELLQLAQRKNDANLMRRAEALDKRNWEVLQSKIAVFGGMSTPISEMIDDPSLQERRDTSTPSALDKAKVTPLPTPLSATDKKGVDR